MTQPPSRIEALAKLEAEADSGAPDALARTLKLGQVLALSGYFADARDMAQAVVKVLAGRELGFGPVASMTGFYIVKGRVSLSATLLASLVKRSAKYDYRVRALTPKLCEIEFFERTEGDGKSKWESLGVSTFDWQDAQHAGLTLGDNYRRFPRNMMFSRALSNGVRWFCPEVTGGPVYTPDESGLDVDEAGEIRTMPVGPPITPAVVPAIPAPSDPYDPLEAVVMCATVLGHVGADTLGRYFGTAIKTVDDLTALRDSDEDIYRACYDRLRADYEAKR